MDCGPRRGARAGGGVGVERQTRASGKMREDRVFSPF
jgi:hypothetical protein